MFLPLSLATLGSLPRDRVSAGSGFYNLTRQLGGSIGIAIITTVLAHREAVHRATLVDRITAAQPQVATRLGFLSAAFARHSADPVAIRLQAMAVTDRVVNSQAMLLSFADTFLYVAIAFVISLPLLFFLGKGRTNAPVDVH
jgi:DHA2 family multidrug resistance protein